MTVDNISPKISKRCQIARQMVSPFSGDKADCHIISRHFSFHITQILEKCDTFM